MPNKTKKKKVNLKKRFLYFCTCCAVIILLFIVGFNIDSYLKKDTVLGAKVEPDVPSENSQEKVFWETFLKENPRYLEGWLELARINAEEGNIEEKEYAEKKAFEINPNREN